MAYVIAQPCIGVKDAACVEVCPVECIHPNKSEPDFEKVEQLYIDASSCIDCGACSSVCPPQAIFAADQIPDQWKQFVEINAKYFKK